MPRKNRTPTDSQVKTERAQAIQAIIKKEAEERPLKRQEALDFEMYVEFRTKLLAAIKTTGEERMTLEEFRIRVQAALRSPMREMVRMMVLASGDSELREDLRVIISQEWGKATKAVFDTPDTDELSKLS